MKDTGIIAIGSVGAIAGILALLYALYMLMSPFDPANLPVVAGGVLVYLLGWVISLWAFPR